MNANEIVQAAKKAHEAGRNEQAFLLIRNYLSDENPSDELAELVAEIMVSDIANAPEWHMERK